MTEPAAGGFARLCAGAVAFLGGRWRQSLDLCEEAERTFRERCTGVSYEVDQAQLFTIWSRYFLGQMGELIDRVPRLVARAEDRGDLYAAVSMSSGLANLAWLALDQVDEAQQRVLEAERRWSNRSFQFQHYWHLLARTQIDLYLDDGPRGARAGAGVVAGVCPLAAAAGAEHPDRGPGLPRARGAGGGARRQAAPALLAEAAREARAIARERTDNATGIAALLRAGVAARRGQDHRALVELQIAETRLHGRRHGDARPLRPPRPRPPAGRSRRAPPPMQAASRRTGQRARGQPERLIRMLAPGFDR